MFWVIPPKCLCDEVKDGFTYHVSDQCILLLYNPMLSCAGFMHGYCRVEQHDAHELLVKAVNQLERNAGYVAVLSLMPCAPQNTQCQANAYQCCDQGTRCRDPRPRPRQQGSRPRPRSRQYTSRPRPRHKAVGLYY